MTPSFDQPPSSPRINLFEGVNAERVLARLFSFPAILDFEDAVKNGLVTAEDVEDRIQLLVPGEQRALSQAFESISSRVAVLESESEQMLVRSIRKPIPTEVSLRLLQNIEIHAGEHDEDRLTMEALLEHDLGPKNMIKLGEVRIALSDCVRLSDSRRAVIGYVQEGDHLVTRSFYLSNSHGVWKLLPAYTGGEDEEGNFKMEWYAKGFGESSIALPFELQAELSKISSSPREDADLKKIDSIFARTSRRAYLETAKTYVMQVAEKPKQLDGHFYNRERKKRSKIDPELLTFENSGQEPDFTQKLLEWDQSSDLYGRIHNEVFPSRDGALSFLFCQDPTGRKWIGGVQVKGPILSTGLRAEWVDAGELETPGFDYTKYSFGYGDPSHYSEDYKYISMYENYTKHIPIMQEYEAHLNRMHRETV